MTREPIRMIYKGYTGALEIDEDTGELFGMVLGTRDLITFVGKTVEEARKSLEESVDFYLERCAATGKEPDRPFSGKFNVRLTPEIHRGLAEMAHARKQSLNELVVEALGKLVAENRVVETPSREPARAPKRRKAPRAV
jgi:predicted HicB family RNase H-like nuclease